MPQVRLNESGRVALECLAIELVTCPAEEKALKSAYKKAEPLVRRMVEKKYPPADMTVLRKYEAAHVDDCIRIQLTAGGMVQFSFDKETGPLSARDCQVYLADERVTEAVQNWIVARDSHKEMLTKKRGDYRALIRSARSFEQVLEVWPEAEQLRSKIGPTAIILLSEDVVTRIRSDVAQRAKAA